MVIGYGLKLFGNLVFFVLLGGVNSKTGVQRFPVRLKLPFKRGSLPALLFSRGLPGNNPQKADCPQNTDCFNFTGFLQLYRIGVILQDRIAVL